MTARDIVRLTRQNLFRRKLRTLLTVLGVVIGCCSIVIMISIGIGMKASQEKLLVSMGDLTIIQVSSGSAQSKKLDRAAIKDMRSIPGVIALTPKLTLDEGNPRLHAGADRRFSAEGIQLVGLEPEAVESFGYQILSGTGLKNDQTSALLGQYVEYNFVDNLRPEGHNMISRYGASDFWDDNSGEVSEPETPKAYFDGLTTPLTLEIEQSETKRISFSLPVSGRLKEDPAKGYESGEGVIVPLSFLENIIRQSSPEAKKVTTYPTVLVKVSDISQVSEVEQAIKRQGFQTYSMESVRLPLEKEARQKQLMLGGLGAISLIVAAIGITNTMIMSITERTKEIGIMKALGCYVRDIRWIFLSEAGMIGLMGGFIGCIISYLVSFAMNMAAVGGSVLSDELGMMGGSEAGRLSIIPPWLAVFAILFSVVLGLGSGFYPANKAVRISALEAIRNE